MNHRKYLSGAKVIVEIAKMFKVEYVFAYPGTSELILCNEFLVKPGIKLINGRGDKESAFMAAGGSLLRSNKAVALLHGARGLTNALGAIADANRNEIGTVFLVGLPSTSSSQFLPPHGEKNLIKNIGAFVKYNYEVTELANTNDDLATSNKKTNNFINKIYDAFYYAQTLPIGPTLVGIPQDALEKKWIPNNFLKQIKIKKQIFKVSKKIIIKNSNLILKAKSPLILVDDFAFKNPKFKKQLSIFAHKINAPIFQIYYRRGPMLFEKIHWENNNHYVGSYDGENSKHKKIMDSTDLLILLEDRNAYPRVVGELPNCVKISITSNPKMTLKNNYLKNNDSLLIGDVARIIKKMSIYIKNKKIKNDWVNIKNFYQQIKPETKENLNNFRFLHEIIPQELGKFLKKLDKPILVDDSQMFGGLISLNYENLPFNVRVFGDHGAFIGGGISTAAGLAFANPNYHVVCTIGDQSFVNGIQGLISAYEQQVKIIYIVCNNGKSVSLLKQAYSQDVHTFGNGKDKFLQNITEFNYYEVAKHIGLKTFIINSLTSQKNDNCLKKKLKQSLKKCLEINGPSLIELVVPSKPKAWTGIWAVKGNEK